MRAGWLAGWRVLRMLLRKVPLDWIEGEADAPPPSPFHELKPYEYGPM